MPPERLEAAKKEFQVLIQQGVARPSDSVWISPLHMVPKHQEDSRSYVLAFVDPRAPPALIRSSDLIWDRTIT
ncbi:hypothetical protein Pmani_021321 [Petrolisthes manimaculis]|uniref:Uncharacterized protein n=1 Tax=Petrolisthes manimaculis TaxID=1843537 RepID=A0AAE1PGI7_9EUCA|nr:hypothetical protein Pmani_021321 [Petrolisthes manimaculis]